MNNQIKFHDDYYYYDIVRKNIKKYRKLTGLTQQELADMIGVNMHYVSQIESANPNKYFTLIIISRIADALNIDIKNLFDAKKNYYLVFSFYIYFFKTLSTFSLLLSESSTKGSLGLPKSYPILFKTYLTGIGFTSQNKAFIISIASTCILPA